MNQYKFTNSLAVYWQRGLPTNHKKGDIISGDGRDLSIIESLLRGNDLIEIKAVIKSEIENKVVDPVIESKENNGDVESIDNIIDDLVIEDDDEVEDDLVIESDNQVEDNQDVANDRDDTDEIIAELADASEQPKEPKQAKKATKGKKKNK